VALELQNFVYIADPIKPGCDLQALENTFKIASGLPYISIEHKEIPRCGKFDFVQGVQSHGRWMGHWWVFDDARQNIFNSQIIHLLQFAVLNVKFGVQSHAS
jgi:hypothetical protein